MVKEPTSFSKWVYLSSCRPEPNTLSSFNYLYLSEKTEDHTHNSTLTSCQFHNCGAFKKFLSQISIHDVIRIRHLLESSSWDFSKIPLIYEIWHRSQENIWWGTYELISLLTPPVIVNHINTRHLLCALCGLCTFMIQ